MASPTFSASAAIVRPVFTAPADGNTDASMTKSLSMSCALQLRSRTEDRARCAPKSPFHCEREIGFTALLGRGVSRKISRIPRSRGFCQALSSFEFDAGKLVEEAHFDGIFVSRTMHLLGA